MHSVHGPFYYDVENARYLAQTREFTLRGLFDAPTPQVNHGWWLARSMTMVVQFSVTRNLRSLVGVKHVLVFLLHGIFLARAACVH